LPWFWKIGRKREEQENSGRREGGAIKGCLCQKIGHPELKKRGNSHKRKKHREEGILEVQRN